MTPDDTNQHVEPRPPTPEPPEGEILPQNATGSGGWPEPLERWTTTEGEVLRLANGRWVMPGLGEGAVRVLDPSRASGWCRELERWRADHSNGPGWSLELAALARQIRGFSAPPSLAPQEAPAGSTPETPDPAPIAQENGSQLPENQPQVVPVQQLIIGPDGRYAIGETMHDPAPSGLSASWPTRLGVVAHHPDGSWNIPQIGHVDADDPRVERLNVWAQATPRGPEADREILADLIIDHAWWVGAPEKAAEEPPPSVSSSEDVLGMWTPPAAKPSQTITVTWAPRAIEQAIDDLQRVRDRILGDEQLEHLPLINVQSIEVAIDALRASQGTDDRAQRGEGQPDQRPQDPAEADSGHAPRDSTRGVVDETETATGSDGVSTIKATTVEAIAIVHAACNDNDNPISLVDIVPPTAPPQHLIQIAYRRGARFGDVRLACAAEGHDWRDPVINEDRPNLKDEVTLPGHREIRADATQTCRNCNSTQDIRTEVTAKDLVDLGVWSLDHTTAIAARPDSGG